MVKGNKYAEKIGVSRPGKCGGGGGGKMGQKGISKGGNSKGEEKVKEEKILFEDVFSGAHVAHICMPE